MKCFVEIVKKSAENMMNPTNLSIVFAPTTIYKKEVKKKFKKKIIF